MDSEKIGKFIKQLREEKNWTQEQLAEKMFYERTKVNRLEAGEKFLKLNDLAAEVATINNVTVNYRTKYIEQTCSYISYIKYRYKNNTYWLTTDLLEEFAWKDFVAQLIR